DGEADRGQVVEDGDRRAAGAEAEFDRPGRPLALHPRPQRLSLGLDDGDGRLTHSQNLEPGGVPGAAPVGAAGERVAETEDRLADAETVRLRLEDRVVAEPAELVRAVPQARLERDPPALLDPEPGGIECR